MYAGGTVLLFMDVAFVGPKCWIRFPYSKLEDNPVGLS